MQKLDFDKTIKNPSTSHNEMYRALQKSHKVMAKERELMLKVFNKLSNSEEFSAKVVLEAHLKSIGYL